MEGLGIGEACWASLVLQGPFPVGQEGRGLGKKGLCSPTTPSSRNLWQGKELSHCCYHSLSQGY